MYLQEIVRFSMLLVHLVKASNDFNMLNEKLAIIV
jgi:hypothetical protein